MRETSDTYGNLLPLKDHWLVRIVRHSEFEVASPKRQTRRPERRQLRHVLDDSDVFWLTSVTQIPVMVDVNGGRGLVCERDAHARTHTHTRSVTPTLLLHYYITTLLHLLLRLDSLEVRIAHNRSSDTRRVAFGIKTALDVSHVRGKYRHFIAGLPPLFDDGCVPVPCKKTVCIHLHGKILTPVHSIAYMSCSNWPRGEGCVHFVHTNLGCIFAYHLRGVLRAGYVQVRAWGGGRGEG